MESKRDSAAMEGDNVIRILGPIDVLTPDGPRAVGGHHARLLLGALVLAAGRTVAVESLVSATWRAGPPRSAESAVHTYVWRLRRLLGADAIIAADHSYLLNVRRDQIDALCFEDLLVDATDARDEPKRCAASSREALALWRGPPFGELADDEVFRLEAMRLDELRLVTTELLLEAEAAMGHHEIVVAELESAVLEHPYREGMWFLLIDALRRDGRRIEALRVCREFRAILAELGVEPGEKLLAVESDLLARSASG
jgi:DNA-binding SARP family transcriptional activator